MITNCKIFNSQHLKQVLNNKLKVLSRIKEPDARKCSVLTLRAYFFPTLTIRTSRLERLRMRKRMIPIVQYFWTQCRSVVPNDVTRDFGPVIAFVSYVSDTCLQAVRERNVGP